MLFHFSALTYNAHPIHFNPDYAREKEGYKGMLVHGPLSLVLMLSALQACLMRLEAEGGRKRPKKSKDPVPEHPEEPPYIESLNYRNLAPLYVDEEMKVCLRRTRVNGHNIAWDVWVEGPEGGLAVKAQALTTGHSVAAGDSVRTGMEQK